MEVAWDNLSAPDDGYDLFRRAILETDADAWAAIHARYRPLLASWVRQCCRETPLGEDYDSLADNALARAWSALSPARFAQFPGLAALLAYLRTCVSTAVIDVMRAQAAHRHMLQQIETGAVPTPEQITLAEMQRVELWRFVMARTTSAQEQIVLAESFVCDLPPRAIQVRHPDLFANVTMVYTIKRNLLNRLQRDCALRQLADELQAV
jgi:DNA-directed RNA polymerase specialized sigma24 family protein